MKQQLGPHYDTKLLHHSPALCAAALLRFFPPSKLSSHQAHFPPSPTAGSQCHIPSCTFYPPPPIFILLSSPHRRSAGVTLPQAALSWKLSG